MNGVLLSFALDAHSFSKGMDTLTLLSEIISDERTHLKLLHLFHSFISELSYSFKNLKIC
jgi:predicted deacylase